jgi:lysozyme family protein
MADFRRMIPYIQQWEGGLSDKLSDTASLAPGNQTAPVNPATGRIYHTNKGIQWQSFLAGAKQGGYAATKDNFLAMPQWIWDMVYKHLYWNAVQGDAIKSQDVADILADYAWGSGPGSATKAVQQVLNQQFAAGLVVDGGFGPKTLAAVNAAGERLAKPLEAARRAFILQVGQRPEQQANLQGWLNRLDYFASWLSKQKKS